jgi:hypothetical protein
MGDIFERNARANPCGKAGGGVLARSIGFRSFWHASSDDAMEAAGMAFPRRVDAATVKDAHESMA